MIYAVIPAAGLGLRMGADAPKQYLKIVGIPILEHTINNLAKFPQIEKIIVAIQPEDNYWPAISLTHPQKIITTIGGRERIHSVLHGLHALTKFAKKEDWVLVHDAVRPCLPEQDFLSLIEACQDHPVGGILGVPVRDTLKKVSANSIIEKTIDRENLWGAQTPQMFRYQLLIDALNHALQNKIKITDESSAVELMGHQPLIVQGSIQNLKITYPEDLWIAEKFLQEK